MKKRIGPSLSKSVVLTDSDRYYKRFLRKTRNPAVAADLYQELWLKVDRYIARHGQPDDERRLVDVAAASVFKDWWRRERRRAMESLPEDEVQEPRDTSRLCHEELARAELHAAVRDTLNEVVPNEKHQQLLLAAVDAATLAARFGTTPTAIRTCRHKLLKRLHRNPRLRELWLEAA